MTYSPVDYEYQKRWRATHPETWAASQARSRIRNHPVRLVRDRATYEADPEKFRARKRAEYEADPEKHRAAKRRQYHRDRRRSMGITEAEEQAALDAQGARCAICGAEGRLVRDHSHASGRFRGFICDSCNKGLGHFADDPDRMAAAIAYLRAHAI